MTHSPRRIVVCLVLHPSRVECSQDRYRKEAS